MQYNNEYRQLYFTETLSNFDDIDRTSWMYDNFCDFLYAWMCLCGFCH